MLLKLSTSPGGRCCRNATAGKHLQLVLLQAQKAGLKNSPLILF